MIRAFELFASMHAHCASYSWRRLASGEVDHEAIWLPVSVAALGMGALWARFQLPVPPCLFHQLTGCPCPGCGATRAMRQLAQGHIEAALHFNPLAVCLLATLVAFDLYATIVLALRLPRFRVDAVSPNMARWLRLGIIGAVWVNWLWLCHARV